MTSSYHITRHDDILRVGFNKEILAQGDRIVRDAEAQLEALMEAGHLNGGKLIKIDGKMSLLVSYVLGHKLSHLYGAIAISDPRLEAYIVVKSDTPDYPLASRIDAKTGEVTPLKDESLPSESSFEIGWEGNILKAQLNGKVSVEGDRIVRDTYTQLQNLIDAGQLPGGKQPLLINGRAPITTGFAIASRVAHLYRTVAVFDPKLGECGLDKYVVVIDHGGYRVGETILAPPPPEPPDCPADAPSDRSLIDAASDSPPPDSTAPSPTTSDRSSSSVKAVICGFPNTGKTCLHDGLKKALHRIPDVRDAYVISGCPDGEGSWFSETVRHNPELARKLKDEYKTKFTPEFAAAKAREIAAIANSLLVFDVGGKLSAENRTIMSPATHAVILAKSDAEVEAWQAFCRELDLPIVAILYSDYHGTSDRVATPQEYRSEGEFPILQGFVHHLDRTEDASSRLMVRELARVLVNLAIEQRAHRTIGTSRQIS
ncbi:MAG TPA: hypothetical protein IGS17_00505 [Oscillatoriales cyanobacterium M59_W2019_021]|nr:hypothetical protein [Oscillatoriales cyanobacterium M4454_W2019_049]HIK49397.1 hypothetical protein [Oscillatoriales cyanobacterium M59_W2019_021]